jgi:hypothetical protein
MNSLPLTITKNNINNNNIKTIFPPFQQWRGEKITQTTIKTLFDLIADIRTERLN